MSHCHNCGTGVYICRECGNVGCTNKGCVSFIGQETSHMRCVKCNGDLTNRMKYNEEKRSQREFEQMERDRKNREPKPTYEPIGVDYGSSSQPFGGSPTLAISWLTGVACILLGIILWIKFTFFTALVVCSIIWVTVTVWAAIKLRH